ncbi:hypothetical protein DFH28DRAFT_337607 [Melampsora americana]|nr:hypothetical protein DFH28DRAFT_337607 [Melampsora americana]
MSLSNHETEIEESSYLIPHQPSRPFTRSIELHPSLQYDPSSYLSPSVNLFDSTPLSPLIQRSPMSARSNQSKSNSKFIDGFNSSSDHHHHDLENHQHPTSHPYFRSNQDKWNDPGKGLGQKSIGWIIFIGSIFFGSFLFFNQSIHQTHQTQTYSSHSNLSNPFPFSPSHYLQHCQSSNSLNQTHLNLNDSIRIHSSYFSLTEEERLGEENQVYSKEDDQGRKICEKSLTYLLDDDFGMAFHLNAISLSIALAKQDQRTFFLADGDWDRGLWKDHFLELPLPDCQPPPIEEMKGCPRSSKHWIITSSIFPYHFSTSELLTTFGNHQSQNQPITQGLTTRLIPYERKLIFEMSKESLEENFKLNEENLRLIDETKMEIINSKVWKEVEEGEGEGEGEGKLAPFVSVHIRKGDRHPFDPEHKLDYIPIHDYIHAINSTWIQSRLTNPKLPIFPNVYVASDTPLIMDTLFGLVPQWNLFHLSQSSSNRLNSISHPHEYSQAHFHAHSKSERIDYTRGQIIDMNFLGGSWPSSKIHPLDLSEKPLGTICTVSSNICQFAALQLGWNTSFDEAKWINLDLPFTHSWTGIEIPKAGSGDEADVHPGTDHHSHHRR